jgi:hypothetical protein
MTDLTDIRWATCKGDEVTRIAGEGIGDFARRAWLYFGMTGRLSLRDRSMKVVGAVVDGKMSLRK